MTTPEPAQPTAPGHPPAAYPTVKLLLVFGFFGGALGGVIMAVSLLVYLLAKGEPGSFTVFPAMLMFLGVLGVVLGTPPALLCALWLSLWRTRRNVPGLLHAGLAGGGIAAASLPISHRLLKSGDIAGELYVWMAIAGSLAAVILASRTLPNAS